MMRDRDARILLVQQRIAKFRVTFLGGPDECALAVSEPGGGSEVVRWFRSFHEVETWLNERDALSQHLAGAFAGMPPDPVLRLAWDADAQEAQGAPDARSADPESEIGRNAPSAPQPSDEDV